MKWTQSEAIEVARDLEAIAPLCGAHIGLTGGCLYKDGPRKDLDIVVYRIRQKDLDRDKFFELLHALDIIVSEDHGFVVKAMKGDRCIDFLFPETNAGTYATGGYR